MRPDPLNLTKGSPSGAHPSVAPSPAPNGFYTEREELRRVLDHPEIARSASLVRFLSFICNKYFEGQAEEIREYSIAVEALGRKEVSFDSRVDPIVRVTARALRKKLAEYYENEGKDDPLHIVLPLGHYVPQFVPRPEPGMLSAASLVGVGEEADGEVSAEALDLTLDDRAHRPSAFAVRMRRLPWSRLAQAVAMALAVAVVFGGGYLLGRRAEQRPAAGRELLKWGDPVWSDEFDGAAQQFPDPAKWAFDSGSRDWGSNQLQTYCSPTGGAKDCNPRRPNAFLDGAGHLVLRAEKSPSGAWTSARITTRGRKDFQYGRIEARMKMPVGTGLWPSFWMLGSNFPSVGWPAAGSVSFIENISLTARTNGLGPSMLRSTLHGPRYYGGNGLWHDFRLPNGGRVDDSGFHTYGAIWSPGMIQFYVDDPANVYFVASASDVPEGGQWAFDHPFFLVMNLAIGGDWPGDPDATTPNPADILVDYVRVYKNPSVPAPSIQWQPAPVKAGSTVASNVILSAPGYSGRVYLSCTTEPATVACSLATPVVNFSDTLSQQDTLTLSTDSFSSSGRVVAPAGRYKLTITATSISGDHSQLTVPFEVRGAE